MLANLQTPSQKHNMKLEDYRRSLRLFSIRDGDQIVRRCHVLIRRLLQDVTLLETPSLTKTKGSEKNKNRLKNTKDVRQATGNRKRCRICNELGHNRETCNKNSNKPERGAENTQPSQFAARVTGLHSQQSGSTIRFADTCTQFATNHFNVTFDPHNFHLQLPKTAWSREVGNVWYIWLVFGFLLMNSNDNFL